ncbi:Uncharacterised protein [Klebsiella pneumoniae]|nr:Uncharacterised protein [Klebsiella pneumoniae]VFZ57677.1 Uncharacterised protein [Klebsiella pneumoniae]VGC96162.1 Uncharacterised protein [Klebsiella pneumoniae]VGI27137.1 Uncharacterised protein [Klebsiella pneumoniae]
MSGKRYPKQLKLKQSNRLLIAAILFFSVATQLDITSHSLYPIFFSHQKE